jgi:hypothetical protein
MEELKKKLYRAELLCWIDWIYTEQAWILIIEIGESEKVDAGENCAMLQPQIQLVCLYTSF